MSTVVEIWGTEQRTALFFVKPGRTLQPLQVFKALLASIAVAILKAKFRLSKNYALSGNNRAAGVREGARPASRSQ